MVAQFVAGIPMHGHMERTVVEREPADHVRELARPERQLVAAHRMRPDRRLVKAPEFEPCRSRGTSMARAQVSVSTVLALLPLRWLLAPSGLA